MSSNATLAEDFFGFLMNETKIGREAISLNYSTTELLTLIGLNILELVGHLALDCPFSALNFWLILHTAILHPNLKFILLCQSGCIFLRGIVRILLISWRFSTHNFSTDGPLVLLFMYGLPVFFRNFLVHVMVLERLMATFYAHNYEHRRKRYFSAVWFPLALAISLLCVGATRQIVTGPAFLNTLTMLNMAMASLEIFVFSWMLKYNGIIYEKMEGYRVQHNLSERYQLSENIRTAKQLFPTMVLHFIDITITTGAVLLGNGRLLGDREFLYDFVLQLAFSLITVVNFCIEVSMIICHPFLKRHFLRLWHNFTSGKLSPYKVQPESSIGNQESFTLAMTDMHGQQLCLRHHNDAERYFKQLEAIWGTMPRNNFA